MFQFVLLGIFVFILSFTATPYILERGKIKLLGSNADQLDIAHEVTVNEKNIPAKFGMDLHRFQPLPAIRSALFITLL